MKTTTLIIQFFLFASISFSQNIAAGIQGYYQFNNNYQDASPLQIEGTGYQMDWEIGLEDTPSSCGKLNGVDSYIDLSIDNRDITTQVSLSAWIKTTTDKREFVISKYNSSENKGYFLAVDGGFPLIGGRNNSNQFIQLFSDTRVDDGKWHHLVGIIDGNNWEIWVDCNQKNTLATNSNNVQLWCNDPLTIGSWYEGNGAGEHRIFDGLIDEVRIYNRPLLAEEVIILCDLIPVSIEKTDRALLPKIKIIPNPVQSTFRVNLENTSYALNYSLFNLEGKLLDKGATNQIISIQELNSGIYFLHLYDNNQLFFIEKIIKQ